MTRRLLNPHLGEVEQRVYIARAIEHERELKHEQEKYERRIKLCKVFKKEDFTEAFHSSRKDDKRMLLVLCSEE